MTTRPPTFAALALALLATLATLTSIDTLAGADVDSATLLTQAVQATPARS